MFFLLLASYLLNPWICWKSLQKFFVPPTCSIPLTDHILCFTSCYKTLNAMWILPPSFSSPTKPRRLFFCLAWKGIPWEINTLGLFFEHLSSAHIRLCIALVCLTWIIHPSEMCHNLENLTVESEQWLLHNQIKKERSLKMHLTGVHLDRVQSRAKLDCIAIP